MQHPLLSQVNPTRVISAKMQSNVKAWGRFPPLPEVIEGRTTPVSHLSFVSFHLPI